MSDKTVEQLRGENAVLVSLLRDCDAVLATIVPDDSDEAERLGDLRAAVAAAVGVKQLIESGELTHE